jgi:hypothetical protein
MKTKPSKKKANKTKKRRFLTAFFFAQHLLFIFYFPLNKNNFTKKCELRHISDIPPLLLK